MSRRVALAARGWALTTAALPATAAGRGCGGPDRDRWRRLVDLSPLLRAVRGALDQRRLRADATIEPVELSRLLALVPEARLERPGQPPPGKVLG